MKYELFRNSAGIYENLVSLRKTAKKCFPQIPQMNAEIYIGSPGAFNPVYPAHPLIVFQFHNFA